jgi:serine/threonine-protein kinase
VETDLNAGGPAERRAAGGRVKAGTIIGTRFQIRQFAGSGGFGERYRAVDTRTERPVDIRILHSAVIEHPEVLDRLREEVQLAQGLSHKNIAAVYGMGQDGEVYYIASEFVDGHSLRELIDQKAAQQKTFSLKGAYNVIAHICNGLAYAHQTVIHGGLAPSNVLVNKAGRVKIAEFGIARTLPAFTHFSAQLAGGDYSCMAPEMAQTPEAADRRADIYSVGVILFELLTGREPTDVFESPSAVRSDLPPTLDAVVERCLRPSPDERYLSTDELKQALFLAVEQSTIPQQAPARGVPMGLVTQENVLLDASSPNLAVSVRATRPTAAAPREAARPATRPAHPRPAAPLRAAPMAQPPAAQPVALAPGSPQNPLPWPNQPVAPTQAVGGVPAHALPPAYSGPPVDESLEIWLVQKNNLDFGPFNMAELKRQIMKGEILGEHVIVDSDSGKRWHVKSHPYLSRFAAETELRRDEQRRLDADRMARHRSRHRAVLVLGLFVILGGVGGGAALYWMHLHRQGPVVVEKVVTKTDTDLEQILKGLSFEFPKPTIRPHRKSKGGKGGGPVGEDFDEPTRLGDLTQEGGDEQLSPEQVQATMNAKGRALAVCIAEERRRNPGLHQVDLEFIVHGNGQVTAVRVNGQKGTPLSSCMYQKLHAINFPKYNGPKTIAGFSFAVR